jgi:hypothetical protein
MVDGGSDYLRCGAKDLDRVQIVQIVALKPEKAKRVKK